MFKAILFTAIAAMIINSGNSQNEVKMTEKKIKIRNNQVEINYNLQGNGNYTLLFLHGWCSNGSYWNDQLDCFKQKFKVCAIDLPGFGKSIAQRDNWTIEEYSKDVIAFIDAMNFKNVIIIGHSMSGEIMLQTALTNNPKIVGVIGIDNFKLIDFEFTPEQMKQMNEFFPILKKDFKSAAPAYANMMLFHPTTSEDVKDRIRRDFENSDSIIGYETCMNQMEYSSADAQRLEQLNYKLYLINSDYSPTNEIGLMNHCKNGFQVKTISSTGHYPMIEKSGEFNGLLEEILIDLAE